MSEIEERILDELNAEIIARGGDPANIGDVKALRRDKKEPERRQKIKLELRIMRLFRRYFASQRHRLLASIEMYYPNRKAIIDVQPFLFDPAEMQKLEADIMRLLLTGSSAGAGIFGQNVNLALDYSLINADALEWARIHAGELITQIDKATQDTVQQVLSQFIDTPGMTIGDLRNSLPFGGQRAETIAVTEVTTAYGEGARVAGERLQVEYPDVKVVKKWYTNEDDRVCPLCGPLGDENKWIPLDKPFTVDSKTGKAIMNPPRHVKCRCWMASRTDING
jgi:hypothetical protein